MSRVEWTALAVTAAFAVFTAVYAGLAPPSGGDFSFAAAETEAPPSGYSELAYGGHYADGKLDLNLATAGELMALPGIGETLAARIVSYRDALGGFADTAELLDVQGIGTAKYAELSEYITITNWEDTNENSGS